MFVPVDSYVVTLLATPSVGIMLLGEPLDGAGNRIDRGPVSVTARSVTWPDI